MAAIELIVIALAGAVWMAWNEPVWLLFGLLAIAPLARSPSSATLPPWAITYAKTLTAVFLGVCWAMRGALEREEEQRFPRWVTALLFAWTALTLLAVLHSSDPLNSIAYLAYTVAGFCMFSVSFRLERRQKRRALWLILGIGGLVGCLVFLQQLIVTHHVATFLERYLVEPRTLAYYGSNLDPTSGSHYRPSGTMSHPNSMGLYFAVLIPFAVVLANVRSLSAPRKAFFILVALAMALGIYETDSRGATVCAIVAILYLGWHQGYRWILACAAAVLLACAALWMLPASHARLQEMFVEKARMDVGLSGRQTIWQNSFQLINTAPFLGVGPGNFSHAYVSHFGFFAPNDLTEMNGQIWAVQTLGDDALQNFHAHNIYLQLAGEAGWLGPLLFLAAIVAVIGHCERSGRELPTQSLWRALTLATAADAAALAIYGLFDSQLVFTLGSLNLLAGPLLALGLSA